MNKIYDYKKGKKRVLEIFENKNETEDKPTIPDSNSSNFTFDNGYYTDAMAIFVDIRESTKLFSETGNRKTTIAKIVRSFSSEIIEIMNTKSNNYKIIEIGIRGDCVYSIYNVSTDKGKSEIMELTYYINTYMRMLNQILKEKQLDKIKVGIGVDCSKVLVAKAGRKGSNINNLIWVGECVCFAAKFSNMANSKKFSKSILMTERTYKSIIKYLKNTSNEDVEQWFDKYEDESDSKGNNFGTLYNVDIVKTNFNNWIQNGMKD